MIDTKRLSEDKRMEVAMGHLLRAGVILSALVVAIGAAVHLRQAPALAPDYHVFHGAVPDLKSPVKILHSALAGDGPGIIQLGLLLLIATPVARVIFALAGFLGERDWLYSCVSLLVLLILLYGLVHGG